jgi:hypothetical protein
MNIVSILGEAMHAQFRGKTCPARFSFLRSQGGRTTAIALFLSLAASIASGATPRLDQNCTAVIANRSVRVNTDGTYTVPNVPADIGLYRVRVVCKQPDGTVVQGQSGFVPLVANGSTQIPPIVFGTVSSPPIFIQLTSPTTSFTTAGQTAQLSVQGTLPNSTISDLSPQALGTLYISSNPTIVSVSADGLITAVGPGRAIITARNEGAAATIQIKVTTQGSTVGDGIPDSWKIAHGFSTTDPGVAGADPDHDGLTNLQEFQLGTDPNNSDTDGDGISDGDEVNKFHTNPLNPDTDGDGIPDGLEIKLGTNPLNPDTDGDGIPDGIELKLGLDPLVPDVTTTVQGRVLNGSNNPVAGASVVVFGLITATTDGTGFFSIQHVPSHIGPITVIARITLNNVIQEGESNPTTPVDNAITNAGVIQLGRDNGSITGAVSDPQNRLVANATVVISIGAERRTTTTDSNGSYGFSGFSPNPFLVTAVDPSTGLRGQATGVLAPNSSAVANIQLSASGTIKGTVFQTEIGLPAVGDLVTLRLAGSNTTIASTISDRAGQFVFDFVPLGVYTVEAIDNAGDRGRANASITKAGSVVEANIQYLGRGTVTGTVRDGSQNPVANATVSLNSGSIFGGNFTTTTDATGKYTIGNVFIGAFDVNASSSTLRLAGHASGNIFGEGQQANIDITLGASATVTGTVFHFDGVTPVSNAQVRLSGGLASVADANGVYTFNFVPLGSYTITATDPNNGDQGVGSVTLGAQDEVQNVNITLNGQGTVLATVIDATGAPVVNALLTLNGQTSFGGTFYGVTQPDGTFVFSQVPAGSFTITATDSVSRAGTSATGVVVAGQSTTVTLQLQPVGAITGIVFAVDGVTAVANMSVNLISQGAINQSVNSGADGRFTFANVPSSTYTLQAVDGSGNVRAQASVTVTTPGEVVTQNLVLTGGGTVIGAVQLCAPSCSNVPNVLVTIIDKTGKTLSGLTDVGGTFSIPQVAVGPFIAEAAFTAGTETFSGSAQGVITADGATANAIIQLFAQTRFLPVTLFDGNDLPYTVFTDGSLQDGFNVEFNSFHSRTLFFTPPFGPEQGALRLDVISGGTPVHFSGSGQAATANSGRELDIQQANVAGLNVTRKILVPRDGYFVRYLEVLQNPGGGPVTVGLRLSTSMRFVNRSLVLLEPRLVATSAGNVVPDVTSANPDRWVILDDDLDSDPFLTAENLPPIAHVFDGPGGALQATSAQWVIDTPNRQGVLVEQFDNITVPAGGQVALLHFLSLETGRLGSLTSAQRLIQLPPEALAGMDPMDLAAIRNFAVPANGVSIVPALESLNGSVTGNVFTGDGTTVIPDAMVVFQSNNPLFARTRSLNADLAGSYSIAAEFNDLGSSVAVPASSFAVLATIPGTNLQSPSIVGTFPAGSLTAQQDIVFTDLGTLKGTVRRATGDLATSGIVRVEGTPPVPTASILAAAAFAGGGGGPTITTVPIRNDGTYSVAGLPTGSYTLIATVPNLQTGPPNTGTTSIFLNAGQDAVADITLQPVGSVTGTVFSVSNVPVPELTVALHTDAGDYRTTTDVAGNFDFAEVVAGVARLEVFDPATVSGAAAAVTVIAGQNVNQNLTLRQGVGSLKGTVLNELGVPVAGATVTVTVAGGGNFTVTSLADGTYSLNSVPIGPIFVGASEPTTTRTGSASGFMDLAGATITIDVTITPNCVYCTAN